MSAFEKSVSCKDVAPLLVFYACDEVSDRERKQIEAPFAICDVCLNLFAFPVADFVASVENKKRRNVFAAHAFFKSAHRRPPNSWRSLRVARKSEFLTVSSVVPRASPIARSFKP